MPPLPPPTPPHPLPLQAMPLFLHKVDKAARSRESMARVVGSMCRGCCHRPNSLDLNAVALVVVAMEARRLLQLHQHHRRLHQRQR